MDTLLKAKKIMTKDEVATLVDLIQSFPILTSRETNASTNRQKEETWNTLASTFNARCGCVPRTKDQLKLKWDNLKKAARKRSQQIRLNSLKTGGGKPNLLGATCTGFVVPFGGDGVDIGGSFSVSNSVLNVDQVVVDENVPYLDLEVTTSHEASIPLQEATPGENTIEGNQATKRKNLKEANVNYQDGTSFFGIPISTELAAKRVKKKNDEGRLARNLAITKYYDVKTEKLQLEIKILKLELARKEQSDK